MKTKRMALGYINDDEATRNSFTEGSFYFVLFFFLIYVLISYY